LIEWRLRRRLPTKPLGERELGLIRFNLLAILAAGKGPAAVRFDHFINLSHQANRFFERADDALVMRNVIFGKWALVLINASIFQPLFADLIAAYMKVPDRFGNIVKGARRIDKDAALLIPGIAFCDFRRAASSQVCDEMFERALLLLPIPRSRFVIVFEQMQSGQISALRAELSKKPDIIGERDAREVDLEKFSVAGAVSRGLQQSIDIMKNVLRAKRFV
jgi:hypothetical protein